MNIVFGKMGRAIYFNRKRWGDGAGNSEAPIFISAIAKLNPQNNYFLIGKSDFSRVSEEVRKEWFPHDNVIDCWEGFNGKFEDPTLWISKVLKDIKIDYGIIHGGMASLSIPNRIYCLDRKTGLPNGKLRSPLQSLVNYCSPITYYLNESNIDWITITADGRYMPLPARDILNPEKISLGVREGTSQFKRMKSYDDQVTMVNHETKLLYAGAEFQYLLDPQVQLNQDSPKTQKVALFFHQYDNKKRIKTITDIIDSFDENEIAVYGKWDREGSKYKGSLTYDGLQQTLPHVKYTFCYPIIPGDISTKWVEAAVHGIIPFFHESYDSDRLLVKYHGIPEWLYVKDGAEMKKKIDFLESNSHAYNKMFNIITETVKDPRHKTGELFNGIINVAITKIKNKKF